MEKQQEISYDESNYPVYGDPSHNEHPKGEGQTPPNLNTAQDLTNANNAYNQTVKSRQTDTFDPKLAASWTGSYRAPGT